MERGLNISSLSDLTLGGRSRREAGRRGTLQPGCPDGDAAFDESLAWAAALESMDLGNFDGAAPLSPQMSYAALPLSSAI